MPSTISPRNCAAGTASATTRWRGAQGGRRRIRVRVERPGVAVRARDSYIYGTAAAAPDDADGRVKGDESQTTAPVLRKKPFAALRTNLTLFCARAGRVVPLFGLYFKPENLSLYEKSVDFATFHVKP
jgi:hypothetical protein